MSSFDNGYEVSSDLYEKLEDRGPRFLEKLYKPKTDKTIVYQSKEDLSGKAIAGRVIGLIALGIISTAVLWTPFLSKRIQDIVKEVRTGKGIEYNIQIQKTTKAGEKFFAHNTQSSPTSTSKSSSSLRTKSSSRIGGMTDEDRQLVADIKNTIKYINSERNVNRGLDDYSFLLNDINESDIEQNPLSIIKLMAKNINEHRLAINSYNFSDKMLERLAPKLTYIRYEKTMGEWSDTQLTRFLSQCTESKIIHLAITDIALEELPFKNLPNCLSIYLNNCSALKKLPYENLPNCMVISIIECSKLPTVDEIEREMQNKSHVRCKVYHLLNSRKFLKNCDF